jgi:hypothetical protein
MAAGRTPDRRLMRRRVSQGPPFKCPLIREYLWDWFVDIRRSVASSISPKFVLMKAKSIAGDILKAQRTTGCYGPLPVLDRHWLLRWKRDKGVVFRKPNCRFKASKQVMTTRLRAMWLNTVRMRRLAQRLLGKDLHDQMYGVDEKPLHFNESGSKNLRTLELVGAPAVRLKQNHAATRERVSVMTMTTSNMAAIVQPMGLPVCIIYAESTPSRLPSYSIFRVEPLDPNINRHKGWRPGVEHNKKPRHSTAEIKQGRPERDHTITPHDPIHGWCGLLARCLSEQHRVFSGVVRPGCF